jgi:hypothetical protein
MNNIKKISTIIGLGSFSIYLSFEFSKVLINKSIIVDNKSLSLILSFLLLFSVLILIVTSIYKKFSKSNDIIINGNENISYQDVNNLKRNNEDNNLKVNGNKNLTFQNLKK